MPKTLFTKLALALTVLLLGIGLLYSVLSTYLTRHYQQEFLQNLNRDLAINLITERELVSDGVINQDALKKTFTHFMMVNPSIEIYMLDATGNILSYSADPGQVKRKKVDMQPVMDFTEGKAFPLLGDDPRSFERSKIFSVAPISISDGSMRYLYVVLRGEEYERVERLFEESFLLQLSGVAVFVSLVIGFMMGLLLFMVLTRRLQTLTRLMQRFSESQFTQHDLYLEGGSGSGSGDEIDTLGYHYNSMAKRIREQLDDLKKHDNLRRELIANVSHDLRTPLAALQGYIETLELKAGEFDEQTRAEYLDIALKHSRRLTRLVEELFELATLDAQEMRLHCEAFAPAELVQDVIQKFSLSAAADKIKLVMRAPDSLPFVYADIGLIERVLENLIGNALRHTPVAGEITVVLREKEAEVEIEVQDCGSGIAESELLNIFDRFYRVDNMERSSHHAGLGLSIAQHIVNMHGGEIRVESEPGSGSRFFFSLLVWVAQG